MVEYADFYVLTATLSPLFLTGGLVAHYRLARETRGRFQRPVTWWYFVLSIGVTGTILVAALFTLSGSLEPDQGLRDNLATLLLIQFGVSLIVTIYDAARRRDVEEAEAVAKAEAAATATATESAAARKRRRRSNR